MKELKVKGKIPLFFLITYILLSPIICWYYNNLNSYMHFTHDNVIANNLLEIWSIGFTNKYIFFSWITISIIILTSYKLTKVTINNSKIETEGIKYKNKDGTYGTADWAKREEIQEFLSIGRRDGIIIGETEENELITLPMNTYLNKNIAVFGASGSGKSVGFAIPNGMELAQYELQKSINREMSIVFTDPKRRTISKTCEIFK